MHVPLKTIDFDYELDRKFIAQRPVFPRDHSKLMLVNRASGNISHHIFKDLPYLLAKDDVLVFNNSKVFPARVYGLKKGGTTRIEVLFLRHLNSSTWECLMKPGKRLKVGDSVVLGDSFPITIMEKHEDGICIVDTHHNMHDWYQILDSIGYMPLPPYITEPLHDNSEYQTRYALKNGSAAAPTAGLHFTDEVFQGLKEVQIKQEYVTLHVGLDTFQPVRVDTIQEHTMHSEYYEIDDATKDRLLAYKEHGKRIVAVGTTSVRVLESFGSSSKHETSGFTDIFIYPGYTFTMVDAMITNFHLPKSTLIMMISAFAGRELVMKAYDEAKKHNYRFYSFGDAMLIV